MQEKRLEILKEILESGQWEVDIENGVVKEKRVIGFVDTAGYCKIGITYKGKRYYYRLHQIIAVAAGNDLANLTVDHLNCNKLDNRISNLEVVTAGENSRRAHINGIGPSLKGEANPNKKLNENQVKEIIVLLKEKNLTQSEIAKIYSVSASIISCINRGARWSHLAKKE